MSHPNAWFPLYTVSVCRAFRMFVNEISRERRRKKEKEKDITWTKSNLYLNFLIEIFYLSQWTLHTHLHAAYINSLVLCKRKRKQMQTNFRFKIDKFANPRKRWRKKFKMISAGFGILNSRRGIRIAPFARRISPIAVVCLTHNHSEFGQLFDSDCCRIKWQTLLSLSHS